MMCAQYERPFVRVLHSRSAATHRCAKPSIVQHATSLLSANLGYRPEPGSS